ncbi:MAG: lycopene cyclase family protein [Saprospiraceae bacterium]
MMHYDYIITGGGCAGLSLIYHLLESPLKGKSILLIDQLEKKQNDRTWCFWESTNGLFEPIVFHQWDQLSFYAKNYNRTFEIAPFRYKMIRGIDFYKYVQTKINQSPNVTVLQATVESLFTKGDKVQVTAGAQSYTADWCFNSILFQPIDKVHTNYLDQHFKGWVIQTDSPAFDPLQATLMDFRISQEGETRFLYVLPFDEHRALVEVAIFSNKILHPSAYDEILKQYIKDYLSPNPYVIVHEEFGIIPMTDFPFSRSDGRVIHMGSAGGDTKASTGYTFWRIQQYVGKVVDTLITKGHPIVKEGQLNKRFKLYDSALLKVLETHRLDGEVLFTYLFQKNPPQRLLRFLNEETNLLEELQLMGTVPTSIFLKVVFEELLKKRLKVMPNLPLNVLDKGE